MRTVFDLPPLERAWLDKKAKEQGISMAQALRQTVKAAREAEQEHAAFRAGGDEPTLEEIRQELRDLLGRYRTSAALASFSIGKHDARLERELRADGKFPDNDLKLKGYVDGLGKVLKKNAAKLAAVNFGKDEQARLVQVIADFDAHLGARGKERGDQRLHRNKRDALFETLRFQTSYLRRIGRAATLNSASRADFDRVKPNQRPAKKGQAAATQAGTMKAKKADKAANGSSTAAGSAATP